MTRAQSKGKCVVWLGTQLSNRPLFFAEPTIKSDNYLDMLQQYAMPQIQVKNDVIFKQDGAPPHWGTIVRDYLDETFPKQWIGRDGGDEWRAWPPRSPDLTPHDVYLWGYLVLGPAFAIPEVRGHNYAGNL